MQKSAVHMFVISTAGRNLKDVLIHTPQPFGQLLAANLGCARFKSSSKLGFHSLAQALSLS
jgi:hypothetical protein